MDSAKFLIIIAILSLKCAETAYGLQEQTGNAIFLKQAGRRMLQADCSSPACPRIACSQFLYGTCDVNPQGQTIPCACCGIRCLSDVSGCSIHSNNETISCGF
ncbi:hypothetical protein KP509_32G062500 [Ceratopteris richardii]|uniref:Uncharacterized protein n=2 Tax=Ceratopteris richardii TaxID=49495 RepID=A0A8T2QVB9_CERRI|nr:hypothetical protein KP509_32G062500 [Ceratopteris richardii]